MNKSGLALIGTPTSFTILWAFIIWVNERRKKEVNSQKIYEDLKKDVIQVHNQSIDESKKQPLIDLLEKKRNDLDPELRKRLEVLEEWKRESISSFTFKLGSAIWPAVFGMRFFPRSTAWFMCGFSILYHINVLNDRQIISGGRQKSYFVKDVIPKKDKLIDGFRYLSYGIMALSLFKFGLIRMNRAGKKRILQEWKQKNQRN